MSKTETPKTPEVATYSGQVLGRIIAELRKQKSLDQSKMSALIGLTQSALSRIETGTTDATTEQLWSIAPVVGQRATHMLRMVELAELQLAQRGVALYPLAERVPSDACLCPRDWLDAAVKNAIEF